MSERDSNVPQSPPSVYEHVYMMFESMTHVSWQKLGLQPDTLTGKLETNPSEAKVAIDVAAHLAGVLEPQLDDEDRRRVQNLLRDLRINYLQRSTEAKP
ncbi:MAG: DUF1844 domain-containing protein [Fimbriimonas sp.]